MLFAPVFLKNYNIAGRKSQYRTRLLRAAEKQPARYSRHQAGRTGRIRLAYLETSSASSVHVIKSRVILDARRLASSTASSNRVGHVEG
jgi:hypothetical protein